MDASNSIEILDCAIGLLKGVNEAKADGNISLMEGIKLAISNAPAAIKAAMGSDLVIAEAKDYDAAELKVIADKAAILSSELMKFFGKVA